MTEPEVSLLIASYYIKNNRTGKNVKVSIDGAHIKTGDTVHFDIFKFMADHGFLKLDEDGSRWQGIYRIDGLSCRR